MSVESEQSVALIHSYGFDNSGSDRIRPDSRGRLQILAGLELLRNGEVDYLIFNGGQIDPEKPPIADVMADHARRILPQQEHAIISVPSAHNTAEEVSGFKLEAESRGFQKRIDISSSTHIPRITRAINREFGQGNVTIYSFEELLKEKDRANRYSKIIDELVTSPEEHSFKKQETILNSIDSIPFVGPWVLSTLAKVLSNKYQLQSKVLKQIE